MATHYDVLNVAVGSEDVVIRAAYRALMRKYHPDIFKGDAAFAQQMAQRINEAYVVLDDPARRAEYDAALRAAMSARGGPSNRTGPPPPPSPPAPPPRHSPSQPRSSPASGLDQERVNARYGQLAGGTQHLWIAVLGPLLVLFAQQQDGASPATGAVTTAIPLTVVPPSPAVSPPLDSPTGSQPSATAEAVIDLSSTFSPALGNSGSQATDGSADALGDLAAINSDAPQRAPQAADFAPTDTSYPNLQNLSREDRRTVELACIMERMEGPVRYNGCLRGHLNRAVANPFPDLSTIEREDRRTIELACIMERSDGPAAYNTCLQGGI